MGRFDRTQGVSDWMHWGDWRPSTNGFVIWAAIALVGLWFLLREMIASRRLSAATMVPSFALLLVGVPPSLNLLRSPATVQISASKPSIQVTPVPGLAQALDVVQVAVKGSVAVSAPDKAQQYRPFPVYLRVAPEKLADLMQGLKAQAPSNATVAGKPDIWLVPIMEASVYGQGFEVEPKDKQSYAQPVAAKESTTWSWQITPTDSGPVTLNFKLAGRLTVGGNDAQIPRDLYVQSFTVVVEVSPVGFVKRHWHEVLAMAGAALAALVGGLWAWFKWLRPAPQPAQPPSAPLPPPVPATGIAAAAPAPATTPAPGPAPAPPGP